MNALPDPGGDPGVTVATGDAGRLFAAASSHDTIADAFTAHSAAVSGTAQTLSGSWSGDSAFAYQALSGEVALHFAGVAKTSRSAARSLRTFATVLQHSQEQGRRALAQAEHWLAQKRTWTTRYNDASHRITKARGDITSAQSELSTAASMDAKGVALAAAAHARLKAARAALAKAQGDQRKAETELNHASRELTHWQRVGEEAWLQAQLAAVRATGELQPLELPAPPMPGMITNPVFAGTQGNPLGLSDEIGSGLGTATFLAERFSDTEIITLTRGLTRSRASALDAYELAVERAELQGFTPESMADLPKLAAAITASHAADAAADGGLSTLRYIKIGSRFIPVIYIPVDTAVNSLLGHQSLPVAAGHAGLSFLGFVGGAAVCSELGPGAFVCGVAGSEFGEHPVAIVKKAVKDAPGTPIFGTGLLKAIGLP